MMFAERIDSVVTTFRFENNISTHKFSKKTETRKLLSNLTFSFKTIRKKEGLTGCV